MSRYNNPNKWKNPVNQGYVSNTYNPVYRRGTAAPSAFENDVYGGKTYTEWQKTAKPEDYYAAIAAAKQRNHPYSQQSASGSSRSVPVGTPNMNLQGAEITYRDRYDPRTGKTYTEMLADGKQVRYFDGQSYVPAYKYDGPKNNDWDWQQYNQDKSFQKSWDSAANLTYGPRDSQVAPRTSGRGTGSNLQYGYGLTPAEWEAAKARQAQAYANLQASRAPQTNPYDIPRSAYNPHGDYSAEGFAPPDNDPTGAHSPGGGAPLANVQPQPVGAPINYDPQQQPHQPYTQVPPDAHQQGSGTTTGPLNPPPPQELPTYTYQGQAYTPGPEMEMLREWRNRR